MEVLVKVGPWGGRGGHERDTVATAGVAPHPLRGGRRRHLLHLRHQRRQARAVWWAAAGHALQRPTAERRSRRWGSLGGQDPCSMPWVSTCIRSDQPLARSNKLCVATCIRFQNNHMPLLICSHLYELWSVLELEERRLSMRNMECYVIYYYNICMVHDGLKTEQMCWEQEHILQ
jgi:hypothetical protein